MIELLNTLSRISLEGGILYVQIKLVHSVARGLNMY
jgi:hypothetical protein